MSEPNVIKLQSNLSDTGELIVVEGQKDLPFTISRLFFINERAAVHRGHHAHIECTQALVCVRGEISVTCQSKEKTSSWLLNASDQCLIIPPMIWASQEYLRPDSTLLVFCDKPYDENDYIRNFDDYLSEIS